MDAAYNHEPLSTDARIKATMAAQEKAEAPGISRDKGLVEIATDHVHRLIQMTQATTASLNASADRILGSRPENDTTAGAENIPDGNIYCLISHLEYLEARISETHEQAERFTSL